MHLNLIRRLAWDFHQRNRDICLEDLISVANLAYCKAIKDFNPERIEQAKLSTFIYRCVYNALLTFVESERKELHPPLSNEVEGGKFWHQHLFEILDGMSAEACYICEIILSNALEYAQLKPKHARGLLYKKLRKQGWSWKKIWEAFKEIKSSLNVTSQHCIIKRGCKSTGYSNT